MMGEEKKEAEKKKRKFEWDETRLGVISVIIAAIIVIFPGLPAVIKGVGALFALLWGADSVRKTSKYGLGTGVPSIGVLAMGYGVVGALVGMTISSAGYGVAGPISAGVLAGVALAAFVGYVSGVLSNSEKVISMKIPGLERGMCELGAAGTLAILLECSMVAGTTQLSAALPNAINNGLIAVMFILSGMAMFHPYNACLGPDEIRERSLLISVEISGLICIILGIATAVTDIISGASLIAFGAVVWIVFYAMFVRRSVKEAYETVGTGLIKTIE
jgi:tetrahydromethanopterin S-methyltransferase subunit C